MEGLNLLNGLYQRRTEQQNKFYRLTLKEAHNNFMQDSDFPSTERRIVAAVHDLIFTDQTFSFCSIIVCQDDLYP